MNEILKSEDAFFCSNWTWEIWSALGVFLLCWRANRSLCLTSVRRKPLQSQEEPQCARSQNVDKTASLREASGVANTAGTALFLQSFCSWCNFKLVSLLHFHFLKSNKSANVLVISWHFTAVNVKVNGKIKYWSELNKIVSFGFDFKKCQSWSCNEAKITLE